MGTDQYAMLSKKYNVPIVVTGFEPLDLLEGINMCIRQLESKDARLENQYKRMVKREGNPYALTIIKEVFQPTDRLWRGIGTISGSGYKLSSAYAQFDAEEKFLTQTITASESPLCISGEILLGRKKPKDCSAFGKECTPQTPLGATMVSSEGTCAAYYKFQGVHCD